MAKNLPTKSPTFRPPLVVYIAPLGPDWSVKIRDAYYGTYRLQSEARAAAEKAADNLRKEGHEVSVRVTKKRPGGR